MNFPDSNTRSFCFVQILHQTWKFFLGHKSYTKTSLDFSKASHPSIKINNKAQVWLKHSKMRKMYHPHWNKLENNGFYWQLLYYWKNPFLRGLDCTGPSCKGKVFLLLILAFGSRKSVLQLCSAHSFWRAVAKMINFHSAAPTAHAKSLLQSDTLQASPLQ